jgi:transcriptional regulator with XRE-family HTH domain
MSLSVRPVGELLRVWRSRRRLSQLDLATEAEISARHLSFVESGRARPSREMLLNLAERLEVPLRDRNMLLLAGGYAPVFAENALDAPALGAARAVVEQVLAGHEPYPALAIDRGWTMLAANRAVAPLVGEVAPELLRPPVNVLRLSLHPAGLAPRIRNLGEWREHLLARLRRAIDLTADPRLVALLREITSYPAPADAGRHQGVAPDVALPLRVATSEGELALIGTVTVFGTPLDVTLSELALECFYPANAASGALLRRLIAERV